MPNEMFWNIVFLPYSEQTSPPGQAPSAMLRSARAHTTPLHNPCPYSIQCNVLPVSSGDDPLRSPGGWVRPDNYPRGILYIPCNTVNASSIVNVSSGMVRPSLRSSVSSSLRGGTARPHLYRRS